MNSERWRPSSVHTLESMPMRLLRRPLGRTRFSRARAERLSRKAAIFEVRAWRAEMGRKGREGKNFDLGTRNAIPRQMGEWMEENPTYYRRARHRKRPNLTSSKTLANRSATVKRRASSAHCGKDRLYWICACDSMGARSRDGMLTSETE
jgi:hypothetical protein